MRYSASEKLEIIELVEQSTLSVGRTLASIGIPRSTFYDWYGRYQDGGIVKPGIGSLTREVMAEYTAEQVYSTARQEIQDKIRGLVKSRLSQKMMEHEGEEESYRISLNDTIILFDTLVQGIELPQVVVGAINRKTEQYYISEEYIFRVEREKRKFERKKIEAQGVRDFQQTVSQGISDSYLRWRGIEATLQLAQSNNSKVVIIGSAKNGLPIILGNSDTPPSSGAGQTRPKTMTERPRKRLRWQAQQYQRRRRPLRRQLKN